MRSKHPAKRSKTREIAHPAVDQARPQRRNFLLALGAGGASAAIVATRALTAGPAAPDVAQEAAPDGKGYALTDHVRRYYRTAKI
jgi:hypothetical protein